jgi:hypothetical protein
MPVPHQKDRCKFATQQIMAIFLIGKYDGSVPSIEALLIGSDM